MGNASLMIIIFYSFFKKFYIYFYKSKCQEEEIRGLIHKILMSMVNYKIKIEQFIMVLCKLIVC